MIALQLKPRGTKQRKIDQDINAFQLTATVKNYIVSNKTHDQIDAMIMRM